MVKLMNMRHCISAGMRCFWSLATKCSMRCRELVINTFTGNISVEESGVVLINIQEIPSSNFGPEASYHD
jgi:hypothetical protein